MNRVKLVLAILATVVVTVIIFQNIEPVPVQLLIWKVSLSKAILLGLMVFFGFALGVFTARRPRRR